MIFTDEFSHFYDDKEQEALCLLQIDSRLQKYAFVLMKTWAAATFFLSKLTNYLSHLIPLSCQAAAHVPGRLKTGLRAPEWISHEYFIAVDHADTLRYPIKEISFATGVENPSQIPPLLRHLLFISDDKNNRTLAERVPCRKSFWLRKEAKRCFFEVPAAGSTSILRVLGL